MKKLTDEFKDDFNETIQDIDVLASKVEKRIQELGIIGVQTIKEKKDNFFDENIADLDELIKSIDQRILELEKSGQRKIELNVQDITDKINAKLDALDEFKMDRLEDTLYDLDELSKVIEKTLKEIEKKKKERKKKKAKYCDRARHNEYIKKTKKVTKK